MVESEKQDVVATTTLQKGDGHSMTADEKRLAEMGHVQELERHFSKLSLIGLASTTTISWTGLGLGIVTEINAGGPGAIIYGFVLVTILQCFLGASLAEFVSSYPTEGGMYHWIAAVAPRNQALFLSFLTGWFTVCGWIFTTASTNLIYAQTLGALIALYHPDLTVKTWEIFVIYQGLNLMTASVVLFGNKVIPSLNKFSLFYLQIGWLVVLVTVVACAPTYQSPEFVFRTWINNTGWENNVIAFAVGLVNPLYSLGGLDGVTHITEEMPNPSRNAPLAIMITLIIAFCTGISYLIALMFSVQDYSALATTNTGLPLAELFRQATQSAGGAFGLTFILFIALGPCVISSQLSTSRVLWAFARDGALFLLCCVSLAVCFTRGANKMTSIDELFKGANGTAKRKFENPNEADPTQSYKSAKLNGNGDVKGSAQASVADEEDDDEAGPSLPPDFDDGPGDDDEGRFFGDGLDENARDAMEYIDALDGDEAIGEEKYDVPWVRKLALNFEKKVNKNASLRAKYENDPTKFMESEGDLDEGIKALSILSEHPELYEEFAKSTAASKLVELLAHENTDIAIAAIEMISELTDEDVGGEQEQWDALVVAFMEADLVSLLISNFSRFDETDEADASGVYNSLSVIENLLSQPANTDLIGKETTLLKWLLDRIQKPEKPTSQNKQYAAEILSILTQSSRPNRNHVAEANGVEIFLTNLAPYRRDDPERDSYEEEYMENLFNCLCSITEEPLGKSKFLEAEGVELCLLFIRDGKTSKSRALKVLDHACGYASEPTSDPSSNNSKGKAAAQDQDAAPLSNSAMAVCDKVVESRGLKPLFSTFMKSKKLDPQQTEHILSIFASLLHSLPGNSDSRFRLLAKFLEKDYEKITKLVSLRRDYVARLAAFDARSAALKQGLSGEELEEWELENVTERLGEGLYCLERIDAILAWLVAEDAGAKRAVQERLAERDEGLGDVKRTLQAQLDGVLAVEKAERDMLEALVGFLE